APEGEVSYIVKIEHPDGCNPVLRDGGYSSIYSNVATNGAVSVTEINDPDFSIYPIPVNEMINVSFGENSTGMARLTISDLTGRNVYSQEYNDVKPGQAMVINTTGFREGLYILTIINAGGKSTRKVVIRH
ncbi:MAG: T9SS type A sorting domain-containing protein, partial [Bacteroidales bacterium]|nr:T9SS type A sorting domain-containing protein [Bacteroidales bacterium]